MQVGVLVPIKRFQHAKGRLAGALNRDDRAELARSMAANVLRAAAPLDTWVVCDDQEVALWAREHGAEVMWRPGLGLNGAVTDGFESLTRSGCDRVIVSHGDLPHADHLGWVAEFVGVTIVPDRRDDGTNVICIPKDVPFVFSYGPGSFRRHATAARRLGQAVRVVREPRLGWDVDVPDDLTTVVAWTSPANHD